MYKCMFIYVYKYMYTYITVYMYVESIWSDWLSTAVYPRKW